jgi:hypothetical protein
LVKNNFCAGTNFRDVSLSDFVTLHQQADTQVGGGSDAKLPSDRGALKNLSKGVEEGSAVRFTGYLMGAHYSNDGKADLLISQLVIQCDSCPATRDTYANSACAYC